MSRTFSISPNAANMARRHGRQRVETALLSLLLLLLAVPIAALLYRSTLAITINYNEGWNAYYTSFILAGRPLYYSPQALLTNNYPPLSFLITAPLAAVFGDALFAGRVVAWLAFAATCLIIGRILQRIDGDPVAATFGAGVFASYMVVNYETYVGMDDPQMLAHVFMLLGLYVYIRHSRAAWSAPAAAALMCCGLFTKHNIIGLPIALAIWLALYDRAACRRFVIAGILGGIAGAAACLAVFGRDFLTSIGMPRPYAAIRVWRDAFKWTFPMQVPLAIAIFGSAQGVRDRHSVLFTLYILVSLVLGCAAAGGDGTNFNIFFEVVIGFALAAGHLLARLDMLEPRLRLLVIGAYATSALLTAGLTGKKEAFLIRPWLDAQKELQAGTRAAVRMVADRPGPALCQPIAICYWAGKRFEVDPLTFTFGVAAGTKDLGTVLHHVASGYYATIVLPPSDDKDLFLPQRLVAAIRSHYRLLGAPSGDEIYIRAPADTPAAVIRKR